MNHANFIGKAEINSCILVTDESHIDENFYYAAQVSKNKQASAAAIINSKGVTIITNRLEHGFFHGRKIIIKDRKQYEKIFGSVKGRVGMNLSYISANSLRRYKKLVGGKIVDVSKLLAEERAVKSNSEIKKIKEACRITTDVLDDIEKLLKRAGTEKELAIQLDYSARNNGAEAPSFPTIVASGANSALPHHSPTDKKITKGLLLIDFGVVYEGYCSDITRTFSVGKADEIARKVYSSVHEAQKAAEEEIKTGGMARDVHRAADSVIRKRLNQSMIHSVGHGLGIEVHELPAVGGKSTQRLKKNMVITNEPGYYKNGWGGVRIEDDFVVGKKGIRLSRSPAAIEEL